VSPLRLRIYEGELLSFFFLFFSCLVFSTKMAICLSRSLRLSLPRYCGLIVYSPMYITLPFNNINTMPVPFKANEHGAQAIIAITVFKWL
jgi:hypothetical protein